MQNIKKTIIAIPVIFISILLSVFLFSVAGQAQSQSRLEANKQLLLDFFEFEGSDVERMEQFMDASYVQHNPRFLAMNEFTGASGNRAWVEARREARARGGIPLVDLGGIRLRDPIMIMAENDLVTAIYKGDLPNPDKPGETYEAFAFETFRVSDGKFTEHWDQVTLEPGWMNTDTNQ